MLSLKRAGPRGGALARQLRRRGVARGRYRRSRRSFVVDSDAVIRVGPIVALRRDRPNSPIRLPSSIELENRRRGQAAFRRGRIGRGIVLFGFERTRAVNDPDVVLCIDRNADRLPSTQWFGNGFGHSGSTSNRGACTPGVVRSLFPQYNGTNSEDHEGGAKSHARADIDLHGLSLLRERISCGDSARETCRSVDILLQGREGW